MSEFSFYYPITIRYSDLDPQGHVNNAAYLSYLESARFGYYEAAGIWQRGASVRTGMVVARVEIDYLAPIFLGQSIRVGLRVDRLGEMSFTFAFQIESIPDGKTFARGITVMVAYDDQSERSIPLPPDWRAKFNRLEKQEGTG